MKLEGLKKLVKEELSKVLSENIQANYIKELTPGTYKIEYRYIDRDEKGYGDVTYSITDRDIELDGDMSIQNFTNAKVEDPLEKVIAIMNIEKVE